MPAADWLEFNSSPTLMFVFTKLQTLAKELALLQHCVKKVSPRQTGSEKFRQVMLQLSHRHELIDAPTDVLTSHVVVMVNCECAPGMMMPRDCLIRSALNVFFKNEGKTEKENVMTNQLACKIFI